MEHATNVASGSLLSHPLAVMCLLIFAFAYLLVILEEKTGLHKEIPVMIGAGVMWGIIAILDPHAHVEFHKALEEYGQLFLFLLAAMTFTNCLEERRVFQWVISKILSLNLGLRGVFWVSGIAAFFISAVADNLTTAVVMGTVILTLGRTNPAFMVPALINTVIAANAGGAWSPFGDITTLMVWQAGKAKEIEFLYLFLPSLVSWIIPAWALSMAFPNEKPQSTQEEVTILPGGIGIACLFLATIGMSVFSHRGLHMPPVMGMMMGLGLLKLYVHTLGKETTGPEDLLTTDDERPALSTHEQIARSEWGSLMFFYGIMLAVGALAHLGYLAIASEKMYGANTTYANIAIGFISAVIDNIPVMFAVLKMSPPMDLSQWLLVTLTAGIGGSMLSIGSAAGVALMGISKGEYTFKKHLKFTPWIAFGYMAGVGLHLLLS